MKLLSCGQTALDQVRILVFMAAEDPLCFLHRLLSVSSSAPPGASTFCNESQSFEPGFKLFSTAPSHRQIYLYRSHICLKYIYSFFYFPQILVSLGLSV